MPINNIIVNCTTGQQAADSINCIITCLDTIGLVGGTGADSMKSSASLTTIPADAQGACSIALGNNTLSSNTSSITIGNSTAICGSYSTGIGYGNTVIGDQNVAIGSNVTPTNCVTNAVLIGCNVEVIHTTCATACPSGNIAIGNNAKICTLDGGAGNDGSNIAIGDGAIAYGGVGCGSVAIGKAAFTGRFNSVAIGPFTCTSPGANIAVAIGSGVNATGELAIGVGYGVVAANYSVTMGWGPQSSTYSVALGGWGSGGVTSSLDGISIGRNTCVSSAACGIAFGYNACVTHGCATALGAGVVSKTECTTHVNCLNVGVVGTHADNAAALTAGLTGGQVYRTSTGALQIVY